MRRMRRGAVNKGLITVLVLTCIAAVGIWIYRATRPVDYEVASGTEMRLICSTCGEVAVPIDKYEYKGRDFKCPKCGQFSARVPGANDTIETP